MDDYIPRSIEPLLRRAFGQFPAVLVTGPRQAGKTTLAREVLGSDCTYAALDLGHVKEHAIADPEGFLDAHPPPAILDEAQEVPSLWPYIRARIDADRSHAGQYVITGSENLALSERIAESLAGRVAVLELGPMTLCESAREPQRRLWWQREAPEVALPFPGTSGPDLWTTLLRGGYPELVARPAIDSDMWHAGFVRTYLERDVRRVRSIGDLATFRRCMGMLAARSTQLLNLAELGRDLGVSAQTVSQWLSVLEATYQLVMVRPYHANIGKRLVRRPRPFIADTGMLAHLTRLRDPEHAASGPLAGPLFETAVVAEILGRLSAQGERPAAFFWRTAAGSEVDLLVESDGGLVAIEAKLTATPHRKLGRGLRALRADLGDKVSHTLVIYSGREVAQLGGGVVAVPFSML